MSKSYSVLHIGICYIYWKMYRNVFKFRLITDSHHETICAQSSWEQVINDISLTPCFNVAFE